MILKMKMTRYVRTIKNLCASWDSGVISVKLDHYFFVYIFFLSFSPVFYCLVRCTNLPCIWPNNCPTPRFVFKLHTLLGNELTPFVGRLDSWAQLILDLGILGNESKKRKPLWGITTDWFASYVFVELPELMHSLFDDLLSALLALPRDEEMAEYQAQGLWL